MEFLIVFLIIAVIGGGVYISKYFIFKDYFKNEDENNDEVEYFEKNILETMTIEKEEEKEEEGAEKAND